MGEGESGLNDDEEYMFGRKICVLSYISFVPHDLLMMKQHTHIAGKLICHEHAAAFSSDSGA